MIEERLLELIRAALETAAGELGLEGRLPEPELTPTKKKEHGDFATNVALVLASTAGTNPRQLAEAIRSAFPEAPFVERVEVAGPGFLNIFVTDGWLYDALRDVVAKGTSYGAGEPLGKRVQVEFVSANPTGPLHVGHARNAVLGDAIARLLEHAGWSVERDFHVLKDESSLFWSNNGYNFYMGLELSKLLFTNLMLVLSSLSANILSQKVIPV